MNCRHYPIHARNFVVRLCATHLMSVWEPVTCLPECVLNQCKLCPELTVTVPNAMKQKKSVSPYGKVEWFW